MALAQSTSTNSQLLKRRSGIVTKSVPGTTWTGRMDSSITPKSWKSIDGESWKNTIKRLIELRTELQAISTMRSYMPFGAIVNHSQHTMNFDIITEVVKTDLDKSTSSCLDVKSLFLMEFCLQEEYQKISLSLKLTFPAEVKDGFKSKQSSFRYAWTNKYVTISKLINTTNIDIIEKLAIDLLKESNRFYFMYCKK